MKGNKFIPALEYSNSFDEFKINKRFHFYVDSNNT